MAPTMSSTKTKRTTNAGRRPLWSGLLLGLLLTIFVTTFAYVAYLFLAWGQSAMAQAPDMASLSLPRLMRPASSDNAQQDGASTPLFQPLGQNTQDVPAQAMGRTTVLIMGLDVRPGARALRADSLIVLTVNPQTGSAGMLSIPRDMAVRDPMTGETVKVNTIYGLGEIRGYPGGGAGYMSQTLSEVTGYPIDYHVTVNFDGFKQIIDLVNGIDIDVPKDIIDNEYPTEDYGTETLFIPQGLQHMDGNLALKYARTRHGDSDYFRAARQQQVILAIKDKITQPGQMAALLPRIPGLAMAMANTVQTDMPMERAIALARTIDKANLDNVTRVVVDSKMGKVTNDPKWGYLLTPDMNKVRAAAAAIFADAPGGPSPEETARQTMLAEAARIMVLNGTQEKALAAKTQARLITNGFDVITVGNADSADYAETWLVTNGDKAPATVEALARWLNIPPDRIRSEPPSDQVDLTIIVGADQVQTAAAP
jgi:polyisoprenyl-teichoic acid--peptidoglycan teichoic acid transferase